MGKYIIAEAGVTPMDNPAYINKQPVTIGLSTWIMAIAFLLIVAFAAFMLLRPKGTAQAAQVVTVGATPTRTREAQLPTSSPTAASHAPYVVNLGTGMGGSQQATSLATLNPAISQPHVSYSTVIVNHTVNLEVTRIITSEPVEVTRVVAQTVVITTTPLATSTAQPTQTPWIIVVTATQTATATSTAEPPTATATLQAPAADAATSTPTSTSTETPTATATLAAYP